jgi:hypothetical protein
LREQHGRAFGDKESIDYALSAFLNSAKSADCMLCRAKGKEKEYRKWRENWEATLPPDAAELVKFFAHDRDIEVHADGSARTAGSATVPVQGDCLRHGSSVRPCLVTPATIQKPRYTFTIDGIEREALEARAEYLDLVKKKVEQFITDHGSS